MTIASERLPVLTHAARRRAPLSVLLDRQSVFSWLMMALPLAFLAALVGYPFFYGILLSLEDRPVAHAGTFVGLKNFVTDLHDAVFWRVAINTFVYTGVATLLKMVGGLGLALAMNQHFRMKNLVRALLLLPFIVPTVLSTVGTMNGRSNSARTRFFMRKCWFMASARPSPPTIFKSVATNV